MLQRPYTFMKPRWLVLIGCVLCFSGQAADSAAWRESVQTRVNLEYPSLFEMYKDLHSHPELSFQEKRTSALVAEELGKAGCEVTTGVGKYGVVGVLRNGDGPTVLVRTDLDALPVKEQ